MTELVSIVPAIEISTDTIVEIETALPNLQVNTSESITVEVQPDTYVLSSAGMYTGNMTGKIPTWILDAIQEQLTTGDGNIASVLDDIQLLLEGLQLGVNQTISQIENTNTSMSALETSLSSRIQGNEAAILDVYATKVTPTEAQAIAVQAIGSTFNGNVDAYIGNLASVYTNATSAIATDIHTLQVSYNDQTARIDTVEEVSLSKNATIRSSTAPTLITNPLLISGDLWINTTNNVTKSWNGSSWADITNTNAQQAYTWSATASKLITAPDGSVTGWSFGDGSNTKSNFKIKAQNFSISDGTTGYTPFSIVGSDINFLGKVSFSSVTGTPTHTSGLLSARPVSAVLGSTYVATNESNKLYTYTATGWKVGGATSNEVVADINAGNTTTINGGKITTGSITAAQIQAGGITADRLMAGTNGSTVWTNGGLISQNFNGNPYGNIGNPTSGFRLSSGASGTSDDPNIYGAYIRGSYIKGSTIDVEDMKVRAVGYPNNFGRVSFASKNIPVVMPGYGTGFMQNRLCSKNVGIIKVDCWARGYDDRVKIALQYSTNNIDWINIRIHSSLVAGMTYSSHVIVYFSELIDNNIANDDGYILFRMVDAGSEQPAANIYSDITVSIFNS